MSYDLPVIRRLTEPVPLFTPQCRESSGKNEAGKSPGYFKSVWPGRIGV